MAAHATQAQWSIAPHRSPWTAVFLMLAVTSFALVAIGVLTKEMQGLHPSRLPAVAAEASAMGMGDDPVGDGSMAPVGALEVLARALPALLAELLKQAIDQPGHLLIAGLPIVLSRVLTGVPWYGWPVVPLLAYREWLQWPSNRWWDPPLDWAFLALGVILATWAIGALRRPGARC